MSSVASWVTVASCSSKLGPEKSAGHRPIVTMVLFVT